MPDRRKNDKSRVAGKSRGVTMPVLLCAVLMLFGLSACAGAVRTVRPVPSALEEAAPADFPRESLSEANACHTARLDYPFFGRPALDQAVRQRAESLFRDILAELDQDCPGGTDKNPKASFEAACLVFNTRQTVSVRFDTWVYTGGAHGLEGVRTATLRLDNGSELGYRDLFSRPEGLWEFLADYVRAALRPTLEAYWQTMPEYEAGLDSKEESFRHFAVTPAGLSLFFPPYQLAPYSAGAQYCDIPLEKLLRFVPRPGVWD
ncbi:MAG: DUF3298 and DUF4163 domain-containing protein [Desulfovibrionaceae bacterium]|nr:DUF3298 and DUF4163 domain-containing protein [Desulfovibrionaceae bacterium]